MSVAANADSVITHEMESMAGRVIGELTSLDVTAGDIRRWSGAVYYPDLPPEKFWRASNVIAPEDFNPFGSLCARPHGWPPRLIEYADSIEGALGIPHAKTTDMALNAELQLTYLRRIRPGDVISAIDRLEGYRVVGSRRGPLLLTFTTSEWVDQLGSRVRTQRRTVARYIHPPKGELEPRFDDLTSSFPPFTRPGRLDIWNRFAAANDELFDIHMDRAAAQAFGAVDAFGLGSQLAAYVHAAVREWLPGRFIRTVDCRFIDSWLLGCAVSVLATEGEDPSLLSVRVVDSHARLLARAVVRTSDEEQ